MVQGREQRLVRLEQRQRLVAHRVHEPALSDQRRSDRPASCITSRRLEHPIDLDLRRDSRVSGCATGLHPSPEAGSFAVLRRFRSLEFAAVCHRWLPLCSRSSREPSADHLPRCPTMPLRVLTDALQPPAARSGAPKPSPRGSGRGAAGVPAPSVASALARHAAASASDLAVARATRQPARNASCFEAKIRDASSPS
jgi:hypothetical protein